MKTDEKNMFLEIIESVAGLKTDIKWIKENSKSTQNHIKEQNGKLDDCVNKLINVDKGFSNHLNQHEKLRREMFTKLGLFISGIAISVSIILNVVM